MTIPALGRLMEVSGQDGVLQSVPIPIPLLENHPIPFLLEQLTEEDEPEVARAVDAFLRLGTDAQEQASILVYNNFLEMREACCYEDVGCEVESQARVWEHVTLTQIDVFRRGEDGQIYLQLMAECEWEREHGLQLTFRADGSLEFVTDQDGGLAWRD